MSTSNAIEVRNLYKHFGSVKAIDGATFTVPAGKIFGFLGPNGAGKTTAIQCLMNFIYPTSGEMKILGQDVLQAGVELRRRIGYLPSDSHLYDHWTGQQHIDFVAATRGIAPSSKLIDRLGFNPKVRVKHLSTGNRQKLQLILAFLGGSKLVIMDEPTRGLDPILQNELYKILREYKNGGGTVFMSSHNLPEVEKVCDSIAVIRRGKIVVEETLQSLRDKSIHNLSVIFEKATDPKKFIRPGVTVVHHSGQTFTLRVKGDINHTLALICKNKLKDVEITHASLEEIFLEANQ